MATIGSPAAVLWRNAEIEDAEEIKQRLGGVGKKRTIRSWTGYWLKEGLRHEENNSATMRSELTFPKWVC